MTTLQERPAPTEQAEWHLAAWPGHCVGCGERYWPATLIVGTVGGGFRAVCCLAVTS
jgi:hypothetical protein